MARCEVCGNEYRRSFTVTIDDTPHVFDSFECAIHKLAPVCDHCGCRVIGHGVEVEGKVFCCASCARLMGAVERAASAPASSGRAERSPDPGADPAELTGDRELAAVEKQQGDGDASRP